MNWQIFFQTLMAGLASVGIWFIYDLIKEFKTFKTETVTNLSTLRLQREQFQVTIRNAELSIGLRVNELQRLHNEFTLTMKEAVNDLKSETKNFNLFMNKNLELASRLNERIKNQELELKSLKVQLGEVMIFKASKNGKS